jgi:hypothetical protein
MANFMKTLPETISKTVFTTKVTSLPCFVQLAGWNFVTTVTAFVSDVSLHAASAVAFY